MRACLTALGLSILALPALAETCDVFPRCNSEAEVSCIYKEVRSVTLKIAKDAACTYNFKVDGTTQITDMSVSRRPRHGQAGRANRFEIAYRAKPGFTGADDFAVSFAGDVSGRRFSHTMDVAVTVGP